MPSPQSSSSTAVLSTYPQERSSPKRSLDYTPNIQHHQDHGTFTIANSPASEFPSSQAPFPTPTSSTVTNRETAQSPDSHSHRSNPTLPYFHICSESAPTALTLLPEII